MSINKLNMTINDYVENNFKLPIEYISHQKIDKNIPNNIEIQSCSNNISLVSKILKPISSMGTSVGNKLINFYTTDTKFLKQTQLLINKNNLSFNNDDYSCITEFSDKWTKFVNEENFKDQYLYIDIKMLDFLNKNELYLQLSSLHNLFSPLLYILSPLLLLLIPFLILKVKGIPITFEKYFEYFKDVAKNNSLFKLFINFSDLSSSEKTIYGMQFCFYMFSLYNGIINAIKFYKNIRYIQEFFLSMKKFVSISIKKLSEFNKNCNYSTYSEFVHHNDNCIGYLKQIQIEINKLDHLDLSIHTISELGKYYKQFYEIYENHTLHNTIYYSFSLWGYIDCLVGIKDNLNQKLINKCKYSNKQSKNKFIKSFYPLHINEKYVTNNISFIKNKIISGPNASGKTTILKSTLLNLLLSQNIGFGCYKKAIICPFDYFHCYINIPDTSGRDSLFQAEARRCKEIIDHAKENSKAKHFCIIDELFSGTNPEEAAESATAFMNYIAEQNNINVFLTTHYRNICEELNKNKNIENFHMETKNKNKKLEFLYKFIPGISTIKSGKYILGEMKYPGEIMNKFV